MEESRLEDQLDFQTRNSEFVVEELLADKVQKHGIIIKWLFSKDISTCNVHPLRWKKSHQSQFQMVLKSMLISEAQHENAQLKNKYPDPFIKFKLNNVNFGLSFKI